MTYRFSAKFGLYGLLYGGVLGGLSVLLYWAKYRLLVIDHAFELYGLLIAIVFVAVGAWVGNRLTQPKIIIRKQVVIREVPFIHRAEKDTVAARVETGISARELDVLQALARGMTNEEIATHLFVSANTVKTHLSNLYFKLDVRRRTQAVQRGRELGLI